MYVCKTDDVCSKWDTFCVCTLQQRYFLGMSENLEPCSLSENQNGGFALNSCQTHLKTCNQCNPWIRFSCCFLITRPLHRDLIRKKVQGKGLEEWLLSQCRDLTVSSSLSTGLSRFSRILVVSANFEATLLHSPPH